MNQIKANACGGNKLIATSENQVGNNEFKI